MATVEEVRSHATSLPQKVPARRQWAPALGGMALVRRLRQPALAVILWKLVFAGVGSGLGRSWLV
jgi:hypothetical protein